MHKYLKKTLIIVIVSFLIVYISFNELNTGSGNKVTGAVVDVKDVGTSQEKVFGKYSIKPSFNQKLDFDILEDYILIIEKAEQLKNICKEKEDVEVCVNANKNILNAGDLGLSDNCEPELKSAFTAFAERVYLCAHSDSSNCICKLNTPEGDYDSIYLEQNKISMVETSMFGDDKTLFELDFDARYGGEIKIEKGEEVILLKIADELKEHDQENLPLCQINKTIFRFCVENNNKQVYAYSGEDKQTKLRNLQYRFAIKFN